MARLSSTPTPIVDHRPPNWDSYCERIGLPQGGAERALLPDFMIVSPARTGTTWLARNLAQHPQMFVPEKKELHYFDAGWASHDLNWYLEHFRGSGGRIKGEATPTYALLPRFAIRHLRRINPALKLIFLLRDPAHRAWSNTKHSFMYPEFEFRDCPIGMRLAERDAIKYLIGDYSICSSDYADVLDRWSECFPRDQVHVDLLDTVALQPELVLKRVFEFLGVNPGIDPREFPLREKINSGMSGLPGENVQRVLDCLYGARVPELRSYFKSEFGIDAPWRETESAGGNGQNVAWLETRADGHDVYIHRGLFFAVKRDPTDAWRSGTQREEPPDLRRVAAFRYHSDVLGSSRLGTPEAAESQASDARLSRILYQLPGRFFQPLAGASDPSMPRIIDHYKGYNIVAFRGRHFGFHTSLGAVSPADYALLDRSDSRDIVIADTVGEVKANIDLQAPAGKANEH